ncbi:MAG: hypothetical protein H6584_07020 [Flavobacteriales bacterium]|nr:hypothetical protein [Flavobacteriales bacterium]
MISTLKQLLKKVLSRNQRRHDIIIFDDFIPSLLSPWRSYEYAEICKEFENVKIYSSLTTYQNYNQGRSYSTNKSKLCKIYPSLKNTIQKFKHHKEYKGRLAYFLFYNNLVYFFPTIIKNNIPFTFTLYPGGGFCFFDEKIDSFLTEVLKNKLCKGVIVNQSCTREYLLAKGICPEHMIRLIPGVTLNLDDIAIQSYVYDKPTNKTNIVFFANKYTPDGADKGFDTFQKIALELLPLKRSFSFGVIGGFSKNDLIDRSLEEVIDFKGVLDETQFETVLSKTHLLISANQPFILHPGAFDGFPLSTSVTASLFGNLNFMTDYFNESKNINLVDGQDFIKIDSDSKKVVQQILELHQNKDLMKEKAMNGRNKMLQLYHYDNQIHPRISHLKKILSEI